MINRTGDTLNINFAQFNQNFAEKYDLFLRCKKLPESSVSYDEATDVYSIKTHARYAPLLGVDFVQNTQADDLPLPDFLFEHQKAIVKMALAAKRFAPWLDCGLGKTLIELEFARQVSHITAGGRVLIQTLPEVCVQTIDEARNFYGDSLPICFLETRADMRRWCEYGDNHYKIAITNYEKMNPDEDGQIVRELRYLSGFIADESSRLKAGGGKQKWAIIHSTKGIPYKLSASATPAPNDVMEFASQASFLERMRSENEIIWTFFSKDKETGEWTVKRHAREAFFEWMSAWSIYVRNPETFGWSFSGQLPPSPEIIRHKIKITPEQVEAARRWNITQNGQIGLFASSDQGIVGRSKLSQIAKGFVYEKDKSVSPIKSNKPAFVADLILRESETNQTLVWTVFDAETEIIKDHLLDYANFQPDFEVLTGKTKKEKRVEILNKFRSGEIRCLISNAKLLGYGMNFQMCGAMIFSGWNDSFEEFYQAVRRAVRFGNKKAVRIHLPFVPELELAQLDNIFRKESKFIEGIEEQEKAYLKAMRRLQII